MERLFLAIPLAEEARRQIRDAAPSPFPGWPVPPANWHLTLRFLGDTPAEQRDCLVHKVRSAPLGAAFTVRFGGWGAFPSAARARVVWLGVSRGEKDLQALAAAVEEAARRAGFPAEDKRFTAHLTVSRVRPPQSVAAWLGAAPLPDAEMRVGEIVLFRSVLGQGPARYEAVERFALA